jgi:septum formation protein
VRLYLASTSPARLATLRAAGIEPVLLSSGVDEEAAVEAAGPLTGEQTVLLLARLKAEAVVGALVDGPDGEAEAIDGIILGGDSAFELDGALHGKPHLPAVARERWLAQRGREGLLHSGHWLIDHRANSVAAAREAGAPLPAIGGVSTARVRFAASITDSEIDAYIATGEPLEVAGAFTIDSLGGAFISEVRGDPHAVVGLSLALVRELLLSFDVAWPDLWNRVL